MKTILLPAKIAIPIGVVIVLISIAAPSYYFYYQYQLSKSQAAAAQNPADETQKVVDQVSKLVELPQTEIPTIATVTDVAKLQDQPFFQKAQNGDRMLIYQKSKLAYLYRPSTNKLVNFGPIDLPDPNQPTSATSSVEAVKPIKVAVSNGTKVNGLASKIEPLVKKYSPQVTITSKDNAAKSDYEKTMVVALNPAFKDQAAELAKSLDAVLEELPSGEKTPKEADILVILGKDKAQ